MRALSPTTISKLTQKLGGEPINIISIDWSGLAQPILYADRFFPLEDPNDPSSQVLQGKILEIANLEIVLNLNKNKTSQAVTVKFDDVDGEIKKIINAIDPHKKNVQIFQWWNEIPFSEKFLIFEGQINTPMTWKEGDRTFTFDVIETLELYDVGFSPEEGQIDFIPPDLINKAWPLGFGSPALVPATRINEIPTAILLDPIVGRDKSIDNKISEYDEKAQTLDGLERFYLLGALSQAAMAIEAPTQKEKDKFTAQQHAFEKQAAQYGLQRSDILEQKTKLIEEQGFQQKLIINPVRVRTKNVFPPGEVTVQIGSYLVAGYFVPNAFGIQDTFYFSDIKPVPVLADMPPNVVFPAPIVFSTVIQQPPQTFDSSGKVQTKKSGIISINPGGILRLQTPYPIYYVINLIPCSGIVIWAHKTINGLSIITVVPDTWYNVIPLDLGIVQAIAVVFPFGLSTRDNEWGDDIFASYTSAVGPNIADVLFYLITKYTDYSMDLASYTSIQTLTAQYPVNFALIKRENIIKVLEDICFQANIAVYLKNRVFYFKYLPLDVSPVDTITENDILVNTLELEYTRTEDIVTKLVARWKEHGAQEAEYESVIRYNIDLYGRQEQKYDYFIYNNGGLVDLSLTFWAVRKANTWKLLKFETPLHKLALEVFDTVTLTFEDPIVANTTVNGIIESANYNSENSTITFLVWTPVRSGEMVPYPFATPTGLDLTFVFPFQSEVVRMQTNDIISNSQAKGALPGVQLQQSQRINYEPSNLRTRADTHSPQSQGLGVSNLTGDFDGFFSAPPIISISPGNLGPIVDPNVVNARYDYPVYPDIPPFQNPPEDPPPPTVPGFIDSKTEDEGDTYQVFLYPNGPDEDPDPEDTVKVRQLQVDPLQELPEGTAVFVIQIGDDYYMQAPVWL